jgi:hypothetical protein
MEKIMIEKILVLFSEKDDGYTEYRVPKCQPSIILEGYQGFNFAVCEVVEGEIKFQVSFTKLKIAVDYVVENYRKQ